MKKLILFVVAGFVCIGVFAQAKKPVAKKTVTPATKSASVPPSMKNAVDSFSYAIGLSIANFYKAQGVKSFNNQMLLKALNDAQSGKGQMSEGDVNSCIMNYIQQCNSEKAAGNKKEGLAFLEQNKQKAGVVTLPSGLQYMVLTEGTGPKPTLADQVKCHYTGSLVDGHVFESSYTNNQPLTIGVGRVIRGWTEALQLMPTGSKWKLFIPSDLAYGDRDNGPIPGGSTLIFEIELLEVVKQ